MVSGITRLSMRADRRCRKKEDIALTHSTLGSEGYARTELEAGTIRGAQCIGRYGVRVRRPLRGHSGAFRKAVAPGHLNRAQKRCGGQPGMGRTTAFGPGAEQRARRLLDGDPAYAAGHRRVELAKTGLATVGRPAGCRLKRSGC